MTEPTRKLPTGRRRVPLREHLTFARLATGAVTPAPARVDYLVQLDGGWQMLGNDAAGDCEAVRWANSRRLVSTTLGTPNYPDQEQVWDVYRTQNPGFDPNGTKDTNGPGSQDDQGMDTQTLLEHLHDAGGPDGVKVVAFATVDHTNPAEVDAALAIFGELWLDIIVQDAQQTQFSEGKPWDWDPSSAEDGGHAVLGGGYDPSVEDAANFITWAAETSMTPGYWAKAVEAAWVVVWPEHLGSKAFLAGVDQSALAADYAALTGKPFPVQPSPEPVVPAPGPAPVPAPEAQG